MIADTGYLVPNWPEPWGLEADAIHQLVIDEEFREAHIRRRHLQVGAWVLPTLVAHGTAAQQERFIPPTLRGEILWCQMFSEPGAGSDLASLSTRAEKVDGGWSLTGQKVWTTMAHIADWGICLARTNPDAPKHLGISCFLVDMTSTGLDIRPLRELTGAEMFNEVFLDGVFVPDDLVVGEIDTGWEAARTTLANERVSMGSGSSFGPGVEGLLGHAADGASPVVVDHVGRLLAESHALAALGWRSTLRALSGAEPGPGGQRAQAAGRRARAAHPGAGPRPARPGRAPSTRATARPGSAATSATAASPSPAAPARSSATSSPNASSASPRTRETSTAQVRPRRRTRFRLAAPGSMNDKPTIAFDLDGTLSDWEAAIRLAEPEHADRLLEVLDGRHPREGGQLVDGAHYLLFVVGPEIWAEALGADDGAAEAAERFDGGFRAVAFAEVGGGAGRAGGPVPPGPGDQQPPGARRPGRHGPHRALRRRRGDPARPAQAEAGGLLARRRGSSASSPRDLVYVGDSYRCDIQGGLAAGVRPIWVDRWATTLPVPDGVVRITDLSALPTVLA